MNLAKKSVVLLAALGVFATTSCGGQKLDYKQAVEWIENHCKGGEERKITQSLVSWDYSKNVPNGKTTEAWGGDYKDKDINFLTQFSIMKEVGASLEQAQKATENDLTVEGRSALRDWADAYWDAEEFKSNFKEDEQLEIVVKDEQLQVTQIDDSRTLSVGDSTVKLILTERMTVYIGSDGYCNRLDCSYTADNMEAALYDASGKEVDGSKCTLGKLAFTFTDTVVLPK